MASLTVTVDMPSEELKNIAFELMLESSCPEVVLAEEHIFEQADDVFGDIAADSGDGWILPDTKEEAYLHAGMLCALTRCRPWESRWGKHIDYLEVLCDEVLDKANWLYGHCLGAIVRQSVMEGNETERTLDELVRDALENPHTRKIDKIFILITIIQMKVFNGPNHGPWEDDRYEWMIDIMGFPRSANHDYHDDLEPATFEDDTVANFRDAQRYIEELRALLIPNSLVFHYVGIQYASILGLVGQLDKAKELLALSIAEMSDDAPDEFEEPADHWETLIEACDRAVRQTVRLHPSAVDRVLGRLRSKEGWLRDVHTKTIGRECDPKPGMIKKNVAVDVLRRVERHGDHGEIPWWMLGELEGSDVGPQDMFAEELMRDYDAPL